MPHRHDYQPMASYPSTSSHPGSPAPAYAINTHDEYFPPPPRRDPVTGRHTHTGYSDDPPYSPTGHAHSHTVDVDPYGYATSHDDADAKSSYHEGDSSYIVPFHDDDSVRRLDPGSASTSSLPEKYHDDPSLAAKDERPGLGRTSAVATGVLRKGHARKTSAGMRNMALGGMNGHQRGRGGSERAGRGSKRKWVLVIVVGTVLIGGIGAPLAWYLAKKIGLVGGSGGRGASGYGAIGEDGESRGDGVWRGELTGGDGSLVTDENGDTFTYTNPFGGHWVATPFDDSARPQADIPALNEAWDYSTMRIQGVNLGGWLVIEPFIVPGLFEPFEFSNPPAVDEWTLCEALGSEMAVTIENHYKTFITERDFAEIAGAGLNWIRLPVPFWMIDTWNNEPMLEGVAFKYFQKALKWARKYGLRVNLDLHTAPGSQNGWNHSGKQGTVNFMYGPMGIANAQRALNYIRTLAQFITQDQYKNVVPMFGIINEVATFDIGLEPTRHFYLEVYDMIRSITGFGAGQGPIISVHDGFGRQSNWYGFLPGADRVALDTHPYLCFGVPNNDTLITNAMKPCTNWAPSVNNTMMSFGIAVTGEWSLAVNDCGRYVNRVGTGTRYEGTYITPGMTVPAYAAVGNCTQWDDWQNWTEDIKAGLRTLALAQWDSLQSAFFWTWKIGNSTRSGGPINPFWSYKLGLEQGWMPRNPRIANGACQRIATSAALPAPPRIARTGPLAAYMTGGAGAGAIAASARALYAEWPPASLVNVPNAALLPTLTPTGTVKTLKPSTPTAFPEGATMRDPGSGWANANDTMGWYTSAAGCQYEDPWTALGMPLPTRSACGGGAPRERRNWLVKPTVKPTAKPVVKS